MSLCIAATCAYLPKAGPLKCVLHCCDKAGTRGDVKSDDIDKIRHVGGCTVLLAGNMSEARQLLATCAPVLRRFQPGADDLAITSLQNELRKCALLRKRAICTDKLTAEFGVSYDEVFNWSQAHPDDPRWTSAWNLIRNTPIGAELIITTFTDDEPAIITIDSWGRVAWQEHYAANGSGSGVAVAFLQQREYSDHMMLHECIFRVLEAKTAAERNPHVGASTDMVIVSDKGHRFLVMPRYVEQVTRLIRRQRAESLAIELDEEQLWDLNERYDPEPQKEG